MIDIDPSEFEAMPFNVQQYGPTTNLLEKFPRLKLIPEFSFTPTKTGTIQNHHLIRYVILVYEKNSPLRLRIKDIDKRKMYALELSGIWKPKTPQSKPPKFVQDLLNNKIVQVNQMIVEYVRLFHEHKYAYMIGLEHLYYSQLKSIFISGSDNVKYKELGETEKMLEQVVTELLGDERDRKIKHDIHEITIFKKLEMRPEDIARYLVEGRTFSAADYS